MAHPDSGTEILDEVVSYLADVHWPFQTIATEPHEGSWSLLK